MFKDATHRQNMLEDIKTIFDGIKCLGLCTAIALGLQWLQEPMIESGFGYELRATVNLVGLSLSGILAAAALLWTICTLKAEPKSKWFHAFSVLVLILIALAAIVTVIYSSYKHASIALF